MNCRACCFPINYSGLCSFIRSSRTQSRKIVLMLVGLDNAGKSCIAKRLAREPVDSVVPTLGFNSVKLRHKKFRVVIYDLGGSPQIRGIWPRYFVDVHGVIFVVDATDVARLDENREVLHDLITHIKISGKPLLLLANKQDREGALDELDIVEKFNLELLVNQQRCPTLVETCSTRNEPRGFRRARLDPGLENGFRWLLRRIVSDYDLLNSRVEQDTEEQKAVNEAARKEWLRKQDAELQVDSLPSAYGESPFRPIHTLLTCELMNGHTTKDNHKNGHVVQVEQWSGSTSEDSPDGSSHTVGEDSERGIIKRSAREGHERGVYIPLHSPPKIPPAEPDIMVISQPQPLDVVVAVQEKFEWKTKKQKKKLFRRCNRTAPTSASSNSGGDRALPPLKVPHVCTWARPVSAKSLPSQVWGLTEELEEVSSQPVINWTDSLTLAVIKSPRPLETTDSDDDDVITS